MSIVSRFLLLFVLLACGWPYRAGASACSQTLPGITDKRVLTRAAAMMPSRSRATVIAWLSRQKAVFSSSLGIDHETVEVTFRDGASSLILPARDTGTIGRRQPERVFHRHAAAVQDGLQALVLEPFATDEIGTHDADRQIAELQSAGYSVETLTDAQVTVNAMASVWKYNVVYMHTHAGVNKLGYSVFATGQPADNDPAMAPLLQNGTVMVVGVAGSDVQYYGILIPYVLNYWDQFPANSLLYIDTCDLLRADPLWRALASKGVGAFVSWDGESQFRDGTPAAQLFFDVMAQGKTVSDALHAVQAAGLDRSTVQDQVAHLGYLGDGFITLHGRLAPPPTPTATAIPPTLTPLPSTPSPTAAPTSTNTPVPTIPAPVLHLQLRSAVRPGAMQVVDVSGPPDTPIHLQISYPSGAQKNASAQTDASGLTRYSYRQPANAITHGNSTALVAVHAHSGPSASATYKIEFAPIDVSVVPMHPQAGHAVRIWVHTGAFQAVRVHITHGHRVLAQYRMRTRVHGWCTHQYMLSPGLTGTLTVDVSRSSAHTTTTFHVNG